MAEYSRPCVYIVEDDYEFAESLAGLLVANGLEARSFALGGLFLDAVTTLSPGPVLLDIKMPCPGGLAILDELTARDVGWPVIMMTGHGDIPLAVRCIQRGATEFIEKPFKEARLIAVLDDAFRVLKMRTTTSEQSQARSTLLKSLSKREREVLGLLTIGRTNKQIALDLQLSIRTVEMHRANLIRRLGVRTTPEAIRIALETRDVILIN